MVAYRRRTSSAPRRHALDRRNFCRASCRRSRTNSSGREPDPVHAAAAGLPLAGSNCRQLVARLVEGAFITDWGPATESPRSPFYEDDGYWRGPIWAPTTYLLWDGVRRQGEGALAREIAQKFCALANAHGMAENFDARSGRGLRDRAFAWTSAVYLLLAQSLRDEKPVKS